MAIEIERKYLVTGTDWKLGALGARIRQGYLSTMKERVVRVRTEGTRATLTIKGLTLRARRLEFEYAIPFDDANQLLDHLCERPLLDKTRYRIPRESLVWEVDEFHGENDGLVVAEVELTTVDQHIDRPAWLGKEVSADPRYFNTNLVAHPYRSWTPPSST